MKFSGSTAKANPKDALVQKLASKPKFRVSVDNFGALEEDDSWRKKEKVRLKRERAQVAKHIKNFDREDAANQAHKALKREHARISARLMEYMDPDEMDEPMDGEPDNEAGEMPLDKMPMKKGKK